MNKQVFTPWQGRKAGGKGKREKRINKIPGKGHNINRYVAITISALFHWDHRRTIKSHLPKLAGPDLHIPLIVGPCKAIRRSIRAEKGIKRGT